MNSSSKSSTPLIALIVVLLLVIGGMIGYFLMMYKPSLEVCSNLYTSNICTETYCSTKFPYPPPEWKPTISTVTSSDNPKFFGFNVDIPVSGTFGTLYNTGITNLESMFDSNVCAALASMALPGATFHPLKAGSSTEYDETKIKCIPMINRIDAEINREDISWLEKSKLLEARRALVNLCSPLGDGETDRSEFSIVADATFPASAIRTNTGDVSKLFCS